MKNDILMINERGCNRLVSKKGKTKVLILMLGLSVCLSSCSSSKTVILERDINLSEHYPFTGESPISGTVKAGTKIEVKMLKGRVAYISIPTVVSRKELEESTIKLPRR